MTRTELEKVKKLLEAIKPRDAYVDEALAYVNKDIALREQQRTAFRDNYETESYPY